MYKEEGVSGFNERREARRFLKSMIVMVVTVKIIMRETTTAGTMIPTGSLSVWDAECVVAAGVIVTRIVEKVEGAVVVADSETDVDVPTKVDVVEADAEAVIDAPDEAVSRSRLQVLPGQE